MRFNDITSTIFVVFLLSGVCFSNSQKKLSSCKENEKKITLKIYYFHASARCETCLRMEKWTQETVQAKFKKELDQGVFVFQSLNVEDEKNAHFADKYYLSSQAVILSKLKGAKEIEWIDLQNIWFYADDEIAFKNYVFEEINKFVSKVK